MKRVNGALLLCGATVMSGCAHMSNTAQNSDHGRHYHKTKRFYQEIINQEKVDVSKLNLFFTQMPKGGDIHHHYTGSIYTETYLEWVDAKGWMIDKCNLKIIRAAEDACDGKGLTVDQLMSNNALYRKLLMVWSNKDYANHYHDQPPPDANFFQTFGYFGGVSGQYMDTGLNILKTRAKKENVSYIETMLRKVGARSENVFNEDQIAQISQRLRAAKDQAAVDEILEQLVEVYDNSKSFDKAIKKYLSKLNKDHQGIDDEHFTMRYQTYASRTSNPVKVFTDLYSGYVAADMSPLVVGVNIVAPENNHIALRDYTLHMRMYNFLKRKYPDVGRSLHAGELTLGMVRPKNLTFHINEARSIAKAQRIGHGVDLPYEEKPEELLKDLKENSAIEINLTSNQFILGVDKENHPYQIYAAYGVPMVISTDDSGVSRNNLSGEYVLLASRYRVDYPTIKKYVYNSIDYSFLSDDDKRKQRDLLDKSFHQFEAEIARLSEKMH